MIGGLARAENQRPSGDILDATADARPKLG